MDVMAEIRATFFEECAEQLQELEAGLMAMEEGQCDTDTVNAVFRAVHSIKGGAGAFSLNALVGFAHVFETTLDLVRSGGLAPDSAVMRVLLRAADVLTDLVAAGRDGQERDVTRADAVAEELKLLAGEDGRFPAGGHGEASGEDGEDEADFAPVAVDLDALFASERATGRFRVVFAPHPALYAKANDASRLIREVLALGQGTVACDAASLGDLSDLDPEGAALSWTIDIETEAGEPAIREIFEFVESDCDLRIEGFDAEDAGDEAGAIEADFLALLSSVSAPAPAPAAVPQEPSSQAHPAAGTAAPVPVRRTAVSTDAGSDAGTDARATAGQQAPTIRVDLNRVDRLIDLVGELVIHQVMLSQRVTQAGLARASDVAIGLDELEQLTREMQDSVMAIRAQPVKSVFQKLPRLVREVAERTGKSVRLVTEGEYTEVDKTVIERLSDPLTHMIRNAIDHGLETPEGRLAAGKSEEGTVRVAAMHRSGRIVIEISDDGAGINRDVVRRIAGDKGLIAPDAVLSDEETDNLIFLPGFSTKEQVSELSGRGVGMDVVRSSIQALGGRVSISSAPGRGSLFSMSLPLTLAVLDGMIVSCAEHTLVVPLTAIIETLQPRQSDLKAFGDGEFVINVRDEFLPLVDVSRTLGYRGGRRDDPSGVVILVEMENGQRSALLVDAIQGQRQVVIKSLEANYGRVLGIAAATILGDGRVALILDVDTLASGSRTDVNTLALAAE